MALINLSKTLFFLSIILFLTPSVFAQIILPEKSKSQKQEVLDSTELFSKPIPPPSQAAPPPNLGTEAACSGTQTIAGCNGSATINKSCLQTDQYFSYAYYGYGNLVCFGYADQNCNITTVGWGMCLNYNLDVPQTGSCYTTYYRTTDLTCTGLTPLQASQIWWIMNNAAAYGYDVNTVNGRAGLNSVIWQITNPTLFACGTMCSAAKTNVTTAYSDITCRISILCPNTTTVQPMVLYSGISGGNYPPAPTVSITQPTCTTPTGSITITNFRAGYSSNMDGGTWTKDQVTYSGLGAGSHTVGVGFGGCNQFTTFTINNPPNFTSASTIGIDQTWCGTSFDPITLFQIAAPSGGTGTTEYQWQISSDNSSWTDIAGATSSSYDPPSLTATRYFRRGVRRASCPNYYYSNVVTITLKSPATVSATNTGAYCEGATIQLNATPNPTGGTFSWSGPSSFSSTTQNPTRSAATTAMTGTYTVIYTAPNGCFATNNTAVSVVSDPSVSASGATTICTGGTATLTATPSNGAGTCTVQWQISTDNSTFTDISGATGNTYTTTALTANRYFRARINCTAIGCDQNFSNSQLVTVVNDPTLNVSTTAPTVCIGGTVTLNATPTGGTGTCTIQWQWLNGATWTNISGATGNSYSPTNLNNTLKYRAQITCSGNGCCN